MCSSGCFAKAMAVSESTASILVVVEMLAVSTTTESTSTSEPAVVGLVCHGVFDPAGSADTSSVREVNFQASCSLDGCSRYHPGYFGKASKNGSFLTFRCLDLRGKCCSRSQIAAVA